MSVFRIQACPGKVPALILSWLLFAAGIGAYFYVAAQRHAENPEDRVTPTISQMIGAFRIAAV